MTGSWTTPAPLTAEQIGRRDRFIAEQTRLHHAAIAARRRKRKQGRR